MSDFQCAEKAIDALCEMESRLVSWQGNLDTGSGPYHMSEPTAGKLLDQIDASQIEPHSRLIDLVKRITEAKLKCHGRLRYKDIRFLQRLHLVANKSFEMNPIISHAIEVADGADAFIKRQCEEQLPPITNFLKPLGPSRLNDNSDLFKLSGPFSDAMENASPAERGALLAELYSIQASLLEATLASAPRPSKVSPVLSDFVLLGLQFSSNARSGPLLRNHFKISAPIHGTYFGKLYKLPVRFTGEQAADILDCLLHKTVGHWPGYKSFTRALVKAAKDFPDSEKRKYLLMLKRREGSQQFPNAERVELFSAGWGMDRPIPGNDTRAAVVARLDTTMDAVTSHNNTCFEKMRSAGLSYNRLKGRNDLSDAETSEFLMARMYFVQQGLGGRRLHGLISDDAMTPAYILDFDSAPEGLINAITRVRQWLQAVLEASLLGALPERHGALLGKYITILETAILTEADDENKVAYLSARIQTARLIQRISYITQQLPPVARPIFKQLWSLTATASESVQPTKAWEKAVFSVYSHANERQVELAKAWRDLIDVVNLSEQKEGFMRDPSKSALDFGNPVLFKALLWIAGIIGSSDMDAVIAAAAIDAYGPRPGRDSRCQKNGAACIWALYRSSDGAMSPALKDLRQKLIDRDAPPRILKKIA